MVCIGNASYFINYFGKTLFKIPRVYFFPFLLGFWCFLSLSISGYFIPTIGNKVLRVYTYKNTHITPCSVRTLHISLLTEESECKRQRESKDMCIRKLTRRLVRMEDRMSMQRIKISMPQIKVGSCDKKEHSESL